MTLLAFLAAGRGAHASAQEPPWSDNGPAQNLPKHSGETTEDYNRRLQQLQQMLASRPPDSSLQDYRIGQEDLLDISVFEAPELNRSVRVAASGEISLPLLGAIRAAGLTPQEMEFVLQELLRRTYMKDPHVSVFVQEMQSHPVSVFGAVKKPGVFQIRGVKTVIEMLSMAQGLAEDAGDTVLVTHRIGRDETPAVVSNSPPESSAWEEGEPANSNSSSDSDASFKTIAPALASPSGTKTEEIDLKSLLDSGDARFNVQVHPGDVVKVTRAGIVYVVGEVRKPGGFELKSNEDISVLQALALAEGLTRTSARSHARIIRTDEATRTRVEIPINLNKILAGKAADPLLRPRDIVFVPNSTGRSALYRGLEAAISVGTGVAVYRR